jgi:hypothetical protein
MMEQDHKMFHYLKMLQIKFYFYYFRVPQQSNQKIENPFQTACHNNHFMSAENQQKIIVSLERCFN